MSTSFQQLKNRIRTGDSLVGIVGLGYVGLPLAYALHQGGLPVLGFDVDPEKVEMLDRGENYLSHLGPDMADALAASDRFEATADFSRLGEPDVVIVCVPTPLGTHQEPDLSFVINSARAIGRCLRPGQLVTLESTTYPCTTRENFLPTMLDEASARGVKLTPGEDLFVAFSPEREDPGRKDHSTSTIPKLVGGIDNYSTELAAMLYRQGVSQVVEVESAEVAEAAKLLENIFRAVNIALVNEMKMILDRMDIDIWQVVHAASTKPFGFMPFYPGPGLGGHCIPIDPFYLTWRAKEVGHATRFIELAGAINTSMPRWVVHKMTLALNEHAKPVRGSKVLVVGLAYKPDIDDTRESPAFELIELLIALGADVSYHDPHVPVAPKVRKHDLRMKSVPLTPDSLGSFDAVLIATNHTSVDYSLLARTASLVIDTRNAMQDYAADMGSRLVRA